MLGRPILGEAREDLFGQVAHQVIDDRADRSGFGGLRGLGTGLLLSALLQQGQGFLQDRRLGREATAADLILHEAFPVFRQRDVHHETS